MKPANAALACTFLGVTAVGLQRPASAQSNGMEIEPRVEAAAQYVSNINLAPDGEPQIDTAGLELVPGVRASWDTPTTRAALDYALIARAWEDSDYNDISHRLSANGSWDAVPDLFSIRGNASYRDVVINPATSANYGGRGLFGSGNLAEQAAASISPTLRKQFRLVDFQAAYRYGRTWYLDEGKGLNDKVRDLAPDSEDQSARVQVGLTDRGNAYSASAYYNWRRTETDSTLRFLFEEAALNLGYQLTSDFSVVGSYGLESDPLKGPTAGGLDTEWWDAGVVYQPDERTRAEFRYGERFFGETYYASITRTARVLTLQASYSETPTVQRQQTSLPDFDPGELPPDEGDGDFVALSGSPFVSRNADVTAILAGTKTTLSANVYWNERNYMSEALDDFVYMGVGAQLSRHLASNLSLDLNARYAEREVGGLDVPAPGAGTSNYYDTYFTVRLNRDAGEKLTTSAEAGLFNRGGGVDYDGWWVGLRAIYRP